MATVPGEPPAVLKWSQADDDARACGMAPVETSVAAVAPAIDVSDPIGAPHGPELAQTPVAAVAAATVPPQNAQYAEPTAATGLVPAAVMPAAPGKSQSTTQSVVAKQPERKQLELSITIASLLDAALEKGPGLVDLFEVVAVMLKCTDVAFSGTDYRAGLPTPPEPFEFTGAKVLAKDATAALLRFISRAPSLFPAAVVAMLKTIERRMWNTHKKTTLVGYQLRSQADSLAALLAKGSFDYPAEAVALMALDAREFNQKRQAADGSTASGHGQTRVSLDHLLEGDGPPALATELANAKRTATRGLTTRKRKQKQQLGAGSDADTDVEDENEIQIKKASASKTPNTPPGHDVMFVKKGSTVVELPRGTNTTVVNLVRFIAQLDTKSAGGIPAAQLKLVAEVLEVLCSDPPAPAELNVTQFQCDRQVDSGYGHLIASAFLPPATAAQTAADVEIRKSHGDTALNPASCYDAVFLLKAKRAIVQAARDTQMA